MLILFTSLLLLSSIGNAAILDYDVVIEGPGELKKLLQENLRLVKWRGSDRLDAEQLKRLFEEAKSEIQTLVATEGYYAPSIDSSLDQQGERWIVHFKIAPNELARVDEAHISFKGDIENAPEIRSMSALPNPEAMRAGWSLQAGSVFRQADWEGAKRKLLRQMLLYRYPLAAITGSRAEVNVQTGKVALFVEIDSGYSTTFGALSIAGLQRYPESTVVNLNPIEPGEVYNQDKLLEFQRRLQDSGYFLRADVSAEVPADSAPGAAVAPVVVNVEENALQRVTFGAGYSTNTGYRGQVGYERLNLFGTAVRLKSALVLEEKKQSALVDFIFPVTARGYRDTLSTLFKREDVQNETTRVSGISGKRAWGPVRLERNVTMGYLRERKDVAGLEASFSQALYGNYGLTLRRTDNPLSPTRGYLLNMQLGAAPTYFATSTPFARGYFKYAGYFPVSRDDTLIVRAEGGMVAAKQRAGIPSDFLFRAGGDQSIRGYGYQRLGVAEGNAIGGGRYLATGSTEIIHWLAPNHPDWGVAAFVDFGNAADRPADLQPVYGYGIGARWKSPVGVINLDVAYGQQVREARLHFSLGVTF